MNLKGVAPGVEHVLDGYDVNASGDTYDALAWALGITQVGTRYRHVLAGAADPAEVDNMSLGNPNGGADDTSWERQDDAIISTFGLLKTAACGNEGPAASTVNSPGDAYDELCVGAFDAGANATDPSDDTIYAWSSVGPTPGGRKKPDLVANGYGSGPNPAWKTTSELWNIGITGTSFSAPQVAGAALLLEGAGISDPLAVRALLIDSARPGRATAASAMGTQTGWQPDWGWGELDLGQAYAERTHFYTAALPAGGVQFYAADTEAAGDRTTVTWNRRVSTAWPSQQALTPMALTDVNLYEYDRDSGQALRASSTSAIDNVEQVRSPNAGSVIYKVAAGPISGATQEPYAIAATRQVTPLTAPQPQVTLATSAGALGPGQTTTVTATATNPSDTMTAEAPTLDLAVPAGAEIASALDPAPSSPLGPGQSVTRRWTVRGVSDGSGQLVATASGEAYGSTLTGRGQAPLTVDVTGPSAGITVPGTVAAGVPAFVRWGAADPSGIRDYTVEWAVDGGGFSPWAGPTAATESSFIPVPGHSYRFRVRATDALGNVGPWAESPSLSSAVPSEPVAPRPAPVVQRTDPGLSLRSVRLSARGRAATVRVALSSQARGGRLRAELVLRRGHRRRTVRSRWIRARGGMATVRLRLPAFRWTAATARVRYSGTGSVAAAVATRSLHRATGHHGRRVSSRRR